MARPASKAEFRDPYYFLQLILWLRGSKSAQTPAAAQSPRGRSCCKDRPTRESLHAWRIAVPFGMPVPCDGGGKPFRIEQQSRIAFAIRELGANPQGIQ